MIRAYSSDNDVKLIGEGGNSRIYIIERECFGMPSAAIKVPKVIRDSHVTKALENYQILKDAGIKTTAFLEECSFDGQRALITENLHLGDFVCLDANAHLQTEKDRMLRMLDADFCINHTEKEPEVERWFSDNKFEKIYNIESFVKAHSQLLKSISDAHIYLAYDCYFF